MLSIISLVIIGLGALCLMGTDVSDNNINMSSTFNRNHFPENITQSKFTSVTSDPGTQLQIRKTVADGKPNPQTNRCIGEAVFELYDLVQGILDLLPNYSKDDLKNNPDSLGEINQYIFKIRNCLETIKSANKNNAYINILNSLSNIYTVSNLTANEIYDQFVDKDLSYIVDIKENPNHKVIYEDIVFINESNWKKSDPKIDKKVLCINRTLFSDGIYCWQLCVHDGNQPNKVSAPFLNFAYSKNLIKNNIPTDLPMGEPYFNSIGHKIYRFFGSNLLIGADSFRVDSG